MRTYLTFILTAVMIGLIPILFGVKGCGDELVDEPEAVDAEPADIGALIKAGGAVAIAGIDVVEKAMTLNNAPQFNPCLIADISKGAIAIAESNVDAIVAESSDPDGKIHLMGGPIDISRCMEMEGKPDPWPPTTPNPQVEDAVKVFVPAGVLMVKTFIEPSIPAEGQKCIEGQIAMSMMDALSELATTTVIDAVNGAPATEIPEFDVDYGTCGIDVEPAADDDSAE